METLHPFWFIVAASLIALLPTFVGLLTSYVKISIVLGMIRNALGTQQTPSGLVVMALSLALTSLSMSPTIEQSFERGQHIDIESIFKSPRIESIKEFAPVFEPWREFLSKHAGRREVAFLSVMGAPGDTAAPEEIPMEAIKVDQSTPLRVLVPAFVLTELKEGFAMAFVLLLPFLVIDLIVANILVGMGMFMVSPSMISLPLKLILFVVADGWLLLAKGLLQSYQVTL